MNRKILSSVPMLMSSGPLPHFILVESYIYSLYHSIVTASDTIKHLFTQITTLQGDLLSKTEPKILYLKHSYLWHPCTSFILIKPYCKSPSTLPSVTVFIIAICLYFSTKLQLFKAICLSKN